jgi:hypothetical protein
MIPAAATANAAATAAYANSISVATAVAKVSVVIIAPVAAPRTLTVAVAGAAAAAAAAVASGPAVRVAATSQAAVVRMRATFCHTHPTAFRANTDSFAAAVVDRRGPPAAGAPVRLPTRQRVIKCRRRPRLRTLPTPNPESVPVTVRPSRGWTASLLMLMLML